MSDGSNCGLVEGFRGRRNCGIVDMEWVVVVIVKMMRPSSPFSPSEGLHLACVRANLGLGDRLYNTHTAITEPHASFSLSH